MAESYPAQNMKQMRRAVCGGGWGRLAREVRNRRTPQGLIWTIYCSFSAAMWRRMRTVTESARGKFRCSVRERGRNLQWQYKANYSERNLLFSACGHSGSSCGHLLHLGGQLLLLDPPTLPDTSHLTQRRPSAFCSGGLPPHCHWYAVITSSRQPGLRCPLLPLSR